MQERTQTDQFSDLPSQKKNRVRPAITVRRGSLKQVYSQVLAGTQVRLSGTIRAIHKFPKLSLWLRIFQIVDIIDSNSSQL
jgi:hypothetical protein